MYRKHGGRLTAGDAKDKKEKIREGADIMANKVIRIIVKTLFYIFYWAPSWSICLCRCGRSGIRFFLTGRRTARRWQRRWFLR